MQIRIGGYDQRKLMYKGYVKLENFTYKQYSGTFCVMHREQVRAVSSCRCRFQVRGLTSMQCRVTRFPGDSCGRPWSCPLELNHSSFARRKDVRTTSIYVSASYRYLTYLVGSFVRISIHCIVYLDVITTADALDKKTKKLLCASY